MSRASLGSQSVICQDNELAWRAHELACIACQAKNQKCAETVSLKTCKKEESMNHLEPLTVNSVITACMCVEVSHIPKMYVIGRFTAFVCNGPANQGTRHYLESLMVSRWSSLDRGKPQNRLIFLARSVDNSRAIKVTFANKGFSASFLFGDEAPTEHEIMTLRCPPYTSIEALSGAIALLDNAVDGKDQIEAIEAAKGRIESLIGLGFEIERVD